MDPAALHAVGFVRMENILRESAGSDTAGDHAQVETPVPIPNTADKHLGPMVVRPARE